jgi:rare lipoprotein A
MIKTFTYSKLLIIGLLIAGCSNQKTSNVDIIEGDALGYTFVPSDQSILEIGEPIPIAEKPYPGGTNNESYVVRGKRYYVRDTNKGYVEEGIASWYGDGFHGKKTSIGEIYDQYEYSAAHKTLPLPSYARVTNLSNGTSVVVRLNDRGPFVKGRIIDLSYAGATKLGIRKKGIAKVKVEALSPYQYRNKSLARAAGVSTDSYMIYQKNSPAKAQQAKSTVSNSGYEIAETLPIAETIPVAETVPIAQPLPVIEEISLAEAQPIAAKPIEQSAPLATTAMVAEPVIQVVNINTSKPQSSGCVKGQNNCLQIGAFSNRTRAESVATKVRNILNRSVNIKTASSNGKPVHIVLIGPLEANEFRGASEAIHKEGIYGRFVSY